MRKASSFIHALLLCVAMPFASSCLNNISEEQESVESGNVKISFTAKVGKLSSTRATDKTFQAGDELGLYAKASSTASFFSSPYIENLRLEYAESNSLLTEHDVYYPKGDVTLDFFAYYPYTHDGVSANSSSLPVEVQADQSVAGNYSSSIFLIAKKNDVKNTANEVALTFAHKLAKIVIQLVPEDGKTASDLLKMKPRIIANNFYTKAAYQVENDNFSDYSGLTDIVPCGGWSEKDGLLVGKEMIVIPQEANEGQYFSMELNGRVYQCKFSESELLSGKLYTIKIDAKERNNNQISDIKCSIDDWVSEEPVQSENSDEYTAIHVNVLSYAYSNISRVYDDNTPVAEICKEYLKNDEIDASAIVVYPIGSDGQADLQNGLVLQFLDSDASSTCGGKISWNKEQNSFTYTNGESDAITKFYINAEKKISLTKGDRDIPVSVDAYLINDIRGGEANEYPMVKIGTQYWMRSDLKATRYQNGTKLSKGANLGTGAAYFVPEGKSSIYMYNGEALNGGDLAPRGWAVPTEEDWDKLKSYLGEDANKMKAVYNWKCVSSDNTAVEATNSSMFYGHPVGFWTKTGHYGFEAMVAYWSLNTQSGKVSDNVIYLSGESSEFKTFSSKIQNENYYKALPIRCIKR